VHFHAGKEVIITEWLQNAIQATTYEENGDIAGTSRKRPGNEKQISEKFSQIRFKHIDFKLYI
jgi:hypothetical protein